MERGEPLAHVQRRLYGQTVEQEVLARSPPFPTMSNQAIHPARTLDVDSVDQAIRVLRQKTRAVFCQASMAEHIFSCVTPLLCYEWWFQQYLRRYFHLQCKGSFGRKPLSVDCGGDARALDDFHFLQVICYRLC